MHALTHMHSPAHTLTYQTFWLSLSRSVVVDLRYFAKKFSQVHEPSWRFTNHLWTLLCVIIYRYKWVSLTASWVMTHELVCDPHSNYNTTHEAVHELMNNNLLTWSLCNWFVHGIKLISWSDVQMSIRKQFANLRDLLANLSKLFCKVRTIPTCLCLCGFLWFIINLFI